MILVIQIILGIIAVDAILWSFRYKYHLKTSEDVYAQTFANLDVATINLVGTLICYVIIFIHRAFFV